MFNVIGEFISISIINNEHMGLSFLCFFSSVVDPDFMFKIQHFFVSL